MVHKVVGRTIAALLLGSLIAVLAVGNESAFAKPRFAAIAVDAKTGKILFSRNADSHCYPASLTKIMTLYVLFQELQAGRLTLNSRLSCPSAPPACSRQNLA